MSVRMKIVSYSAIEVDVVANQGKNKYKEEGEEKPSMPMASHRPNLRSLSADLVSGLYIYSAEESVLYKASYHLA